MSMITSLLKATSLYFVAVAFLSLGSSASLAAPTNKNFATAGFDADALAVIQKIQANNLAVDVFTFTRSGHWIIIADDTAYYSDASKFESLKAYDGTSIRQKIEEYLSLGKRIDVVSFTNQGNWIVVADDHRFYSDKQAFNSIQLRPKLEELIRGGKRIQSISVSDNGRWVIVAGGLAFGQNLPAEMKKALATAFEFEKRLVFGAWFRPGRPSEWLVLAGNKYWSSGSVEGRIDDAFNEFRRKSWAVDLVTLDGSSGVALISSLEFGGGLSIADRLEMGIGSESGSGVTIWDLMKSNNVPGVAIAIVQDNRIQSIRGYGKRKQGKNYVFHDSIFSVASLSKAVGAFGILKGVDLGYLELSTTPAEVAARHPGSVVDRWYQLLDAEVSSPNEGTDDSEQSVARQIRVVDMLSHTAGLNRSGIGLRDPKLEMAAGDVILGKKKFNDSTGVLRPSVAPPRTRWSYSGGGFTLAEVMLELESGGSFENFMAREVLEPLRMTSSTFGSVSKSQKESRLAWGHFPSGNAEKYLESPGKAAAGLFSTAGDYARFLIAVMNNGSIDGQQVLSRSMVEQMLTPAVLDGGSGRACSSDASCSANGELCVMNQCRVPIRDSNSFLSGAGIVLSNDRDPSTGISVSISHGGRAKGYRAFFAASPRKGSGIVILANGPESGNLRRQITRTFGSMEAWRP